MTGVQTCALPISYVASTPGELAVILQKKQEFCRVSDCMFVNGVIFWGAPAMVGDTVIAQTSSRKY